MAITAQYAAGTLAAAARGEEMPTWELTRAYVEACGVVDQEEIKQWQRGWEAAQKAAKIMPSNRRLAAEEMPDPRQVKTYRSLLDQLSTLKIAAGNLPYRSFYFGVPGSRAGGGPSRLPASTISDLFNGRHVGRFNLFAMVVCGLVQQVVSLYGEPHPDDDVAWHDLTAWHEAWRRAITHRTQTKDTITRKQVALAEVVSWIANDHPKLAASVLTHLEPDRRERVLQDLPLDIATAVHQAGPTPLSTTTT